MCLFKDFLKKSEFPKCCICLEYLSKCNILYILRCGHIYCSVCLSLINSKFFEKQISCPKCRQYSSSIQVKNNQFKCVLCGKCLFKLSEANKFVFILNCGHTYCMNCLKIHNKYVYCSVCLKYYRFYRFYF